MKKLLKFSAAVSAAICAVLLFATAQQGDRLRIGGKEFEIFTNPLAPYLEQNPHKLPGSNVTSSALWRGYVATWEVKEQSMLLVDVQILESASKPGDRPSLDQ